MLINVLYCSLRSYQLPFSTARYFSTGLLCVSVYADGLGGVNELLIHFIQNVNWNSCLNNNNNNYRAFIVNPVFIHCKKESLNRSTTGNITQRLPTTHCLKSTLKVSRWMKLPSIITVAPVCNTVHVLLWENIPTHWPLKKKSTPAFSLCNKQYPSPVGRPLKVFHDETL